MPAKWADIFIHAYSPEERREVKGRGVTYQVVTWTRYGCACGWATQWCRDPERARRQIVKHALDGQVAQVP